MSQMNTSFESFERKCLPDFLVGGAMLVWAARQSGRLAELQERVRMRRSGYSGIDAVVALMLMFSNRQCMSISGFCSQAADYGRRLAAMAGRSRLMSQASMSRLLGRLSIEDAQSWVSYLLLDFSEVRSKLLDRDDVRYRNRRGTLQHVVAYDPVNTGVRQRELTSSDDHPEPSRRSDRLASPMRLGRSRGEVGFRMTTTWHHGAGVWIDTNIGTGKGVHADQFQQALRATASLARPGEPAPIMLADGEQGVVRYFSMARDHRVELITRFHNYKLLEEEAVLQRMRDGAWYPVPDAGSGPVRWALDLGDCELYSRSLGESVTVRIVVTRFAKADASGAGKAIDGQHFELLAAVDVDPLALTATDVSCLYYHRCGQENAIGRAKQEERLGRTYSNEPGGQLFAVALALSVWNQQVVRGAVESDPPFPLQPTRPSDDAPALPDAILASGPQTAENIDLLEIVDESEAPTSTEDDEPSAAFKATMNGLPWSHLLRRRKGWRWDAEEQVLRDDQGHCFILNRVDDDPRGPKARFRAHSDTRQATLSITDELAATLKRLLKQTKRSRRAVKAPTPDGRNVRLVVPAVDDQVNGNVHFASFDGSKSRRRSLAMAAFATFIVSIPPASQTPLPAAPERRWHRPLTWSQRHQRYANEHAVNVVIQATDAAKQWLTR